MKLTSPMIAGISIAVLLCLVQLYVDFEWFSSSGDVTRLKAANGSYSAQLASVQGSVEEFKQTLKKYDAQIGEHGTIQLLAKAIASGDAELSIKSLKIVSNNKAVVSLGSVPDAGGLIQVLSNDGSGTAEISSAPGKSRIGFKVTTGADAASAVHVATYGGDGLYLQKGTTEDMASRSDGAGFQILDAGGSFFMAQKDGGNVSIATTAADDRASLRVWSEADPSKVVKLALGAKNASPYVSLSGAESGYLMTLVPDRLTLATKDGTTDLSVAGDDAGGFVIVSDKAGERRAFMASGNEGHGSISVYGNDGRSNTLYPEYNIQKTGSSQK
jgi:hypothetical protein